MPKIASLKKVVLSGAATVVTAAGLLAVGPARAEAASGFTVRLVPGSVSGVYLFLDVSGASTEPGADIIQWWYTGGTNQVWTFRPRDSYYEIVNKNSGQCVTTRGRAGAPLYQWPCTGMDRQLWDTALTPGDVFHEYTIRNPATNLYVDVNGNSAAPGAAIVGWYRNGNLNQTFLGYLY